MAPTLSINTVTGLWFHHIDISKACLWIGLPWWLSGKESACQAGDARQIFGNALLTSLRDIQMPKHLVWVLIRKHRGFPDGSAIKNPLANAGDAGNLGLIPGSRGSGKGNSSPLQYSHLENPMNRGAWQATVCRVARVRHDLATKPPPPFLV